MPDTTTTVIGFDFGTYWIGVAVGQTLTRQATPLPALRNNDWKAIANCSTSGARSNWWSACRSA